MLKQNFSATPSFIGTTNFLSLMSGKEFFVNRYRELGWTYKDVKLKPSIRINTINSNRDDVVNRLESLGMTLEKIAFLEDGYWISKSDFSIGATAEYLLGLYSIQEAAAQIPATLFTELEDKTLLDACASPGGKTVQLANLMKNSGVIVALDIKRRRLFPLSNQLERSRVRNTIVYQLDAREASRLNMKFDRVLLDVPCSGNYVTDKDWFSRRTVEDVERNAGRQKQILTEAVKIVKDDGEIVYATCSLEPEENELNINWTIETLNLQVEEIKCHGEKGLTDVFGRKLNQSIEKCKRIWPGQTQGFFVCKLRKQALG
uniref:Proliferating-cell nucleolar protein p120 n=1 Tax=uncultured miscellaneous Crenarchaeota group TaxID=1368239 RepID=W8RLZ1_9ARCH|nr:proliferating-cell nucleolar protein p120 [uncultured miscellaneous Crenarchaeota group]